MNRRAQCLRFGRWILRYGLAVSSALLLPTALECGAAPPARAQVYQRLHAFQAISADGAFPGALIQGPDGALYGTAGGGGTFARGALFRADENGLTVVRSFRGVDGQRPNALVAADDGSLYGVTSASGIPDFGGVLFRLDPGGDLTVLASFGKGQPSPALIQADDGAFYGTTTPAPGSSDPDIFYRATRDGTITPLHRFLRTEALGSNGVIQGRDGDFYGTSRSGGSGMFTGQGTVFRATAAGDVMVLHTFQGQEGSAPIGQLVEGEDGVFYGVTSGVPSRIFSIGSDGVFRTLHTFSGQEGLSATTGLLAGPDGAFYGATGIGGPAGGGTLFRVTSTGQLTVLHGFDPAADEGTGPVHLLWGNDGLLYGVSERGGATGAGTLFALNTDDLTFQILAPFLWGTEASGPQALARTDTGDLYGVTAAGGAKNGGTAFALNASGAPTVLHSFTGPDGLYPSALLSGSDGVFYGTAEGGGAFGAGAVFAMTPDGSVGVLHSFSAGQEGSAPYTLVQGPDGSLLGTTRFSGPQGGGTLFQIDPDGRFRVLHNFRTNGSEGYQPAVFLTDGEGTAWGVTQGSGTDSGVLFKVSAAGLFSVVHTFSRQFEGANPGGLALEDGGSLLGTLASGGTNGGGAVYRLKPDGQLQIVTSFAVFGSAGWAPILLATGTMGTVYGVNGSGGDAFSGTVFQLDSGGQPVRLHSFRPFDMDGVLPKALVVGEGETLYGALYYGGQVARTNSISTDDTFGLIFHLNPKTPQLRDVTGSIQTSASELTRDPDTDTFKGSLTVTNAGTVDIPGPVQIVFRSQRSNEVLVNQIGRLDGAAFLTLPDGLPAGASLVVPVEFNRAQVAYQLKILSGAL